MYRDLERLENLIYSPFRKISDILFQKKDLNKHFKQLKEAIDKQGQNLLIEIDTIIKKMKADVEYMDSKHLDDLKKKGRRNNMQNFRNRTRHC